MCRLTDAARWALGIHPYVWTPKQPPARIGARGVTVNGTGLIRPPDGLTPDECRLLEALEREIRLIRQMARGLG